MDPRMMQMLRKRFGGRGFRPSEMPLTGDPSRPEELPFSPDDALPVLDYAVSTPTGEARVTRDGLPEFSPDNGQTPLVTPSGEPRRAKSSPFMADTAKEPDIASDLSVPLTPEEKAGLGDPRASAGQQDMRQSFDRMSNVFLNAGGLAPLTPRKDPYVSERDEMRDWVMKRGGVARSAEKGALDSERTGAYLAATKAQQERAAGAHALQAEREGRMADAEKFRQETTRLEAERKKLESERDQKNKDREFAAKNKPKPAPVPGGNRKDATELRKEFNQLPDVKAFNEVEGSFQKIQSSATNDSPAGDLALITGFMKIIDPGSSVKEGEFANAQNAGGVSDKIRAKYNSIVSGERLSPSQRADFLKQAQALYDVHKGKYDKQADRYRSLATKANSDPDDVTGVRGEAPPPAAPARKTATLKDGSKVQLSADGKSWEPIK